MNSSNSKWVLVPNLCELGEQPFLRKETHPLHRFKGKEKYLAVLRSLSYQCRSVFARMFLFGLQDERKEMKLHRSLTVLTEKEILSLEQLFQLLSENSSQQEFSA
jgi:hypothetical protein